ncbi:methyl-accepting chemotaxis protein [Gemmatimonas sp.]|uniref:methyl-accepting chemotaxis protein n=1 Tax=Gemmatimonas sp. TaxID=1962908 RepID=UPI003341E2C6
MAAPAFFSSPTPRSVRRLPTPAALRALPVSAATLFEEERAKDVATFRVAARRRLWSTVIIAAVLVAALQAGLATVSLWTVFAMFGAAIGLNGVLAVLGSRPALYRRWLKYVFASFDALLISSVVYVFGAPVLVLAYILAIVPYSFDRGPALGYVTTGVSVAGFLAASFAHNAVSSQHPTPVPQILLAAGLLLIVAQQVIQMPTRLIMRLRRTRERMAQVERGDLSARADARHSDELGFLERSFNGMLDELQLLIETVQREADELAAVATQVYGAASTLQRRAVEVAGGAHSLSDELHVQQERAAEGLRTGQDARRTADAARRTAEITANDAHTLDDMAGASREAIERAAQALVRVGTDVNAAATTVRALQPASEHVGHFVDTVSRIARQTNMLALNAAIEASRAGEDGLGFAVVADEIRALSVESGLAAKRVAATVQRVRDDISAAVLAMDTTADEVQGAGTIARDATRALSGMVEGISRITKQSDEVALLAQTQAQLSATAASAFEALDLSAQRASSGARTAAESSTAQRSSIEELSRSAQQLSQAAARMRTVALRHTTEFPVVK